jgi:hypothetical protein
VGARLAAAVAFAAVLLAYGPAVRAAGARYAIVVGDNVGDPGEVALAYAQTDAAQVADVLRSVGDFHAEDVALLTAVTADEVRRAVITLNARLRQAGGPSGGAMLLVFYSGHADAEALHLVGTRLGLSELRDLVTGSSAETRVLIVDSCRSGALTRVKGGRPVPSFDVHVEAPPAAQGLAILTSSAAGEDAQESDQLQASIFTHHLLSALLGAADRDRNGLVTVDEAFGYASERTLASTVSTWPGPQHPTYRLELGGRGDLVLADPGRQSRHRGALAFAAAGSYLVQRSGGEGRVVAELTSDRPEGQLALEEGPYFVTERHRDHLRQGEFVVGAGKVTVVEPAKMKRIDYAAVVRKGGAERVHVLSLFAGAGVRGEILDLGTAFLTDLGARLDLPSVTFELRLGLGGSRHQNERLQITTYETALSLAGLHMFDFARLSVGVGLEVGVSWLAQRFAGAAALPRDLLAPMFGPVAQLEVPLTARTWLRADAAVPTYLVGNDGPPARPTLVSYRFGVSAGAYF